ncbi:hypothetical protein ACFY2H_42400, partial [Streptomyces griseofuscus]|uniref:hypothetical protein n=1 Tax=Streptomyces griseofuscus TaxID=146922 RepID=UPI003682885A
ETSNTSLNGTGASCVAEVELVTRSVAPLKTLTVATEESTSRTQHQRCPSPIVTTDYGTEPLV